ncbi:MAG: ABC transporter substrate-binding protein [Oscillospiraceae bacterium]|nr:ABC transporter substrate-binding protein [Oscillospiraceae bacterium]
MKRTAVLIWILAMLLVLCACGAGPEPEQPKEPVTLRVVTSFGMEDGNRRNFEAAVAEYEQTTGVTVQDYSDISNEEWKAKVLADFETGSEPDVLFFFANEDAEPIIQAKKVVSIEEIRTEYPEYASNMDEAKLPQASDGQNYAVPIMGYWEFLYVNKAVLAECGVKIPGSDYSWEQFLADCAVIRDSGYTPIACSLAEVAHYWFEFAVMNNGSMRSHLQIPALNARGELSLNFTAKKWIAGLEDIRDLYEQGFFPANTLAVGDAETVAMFGEGKAAFLLDGSWKVGYFSANYADRLNDFAVCYVPAKGTRSATQTVGGISTGFFITRKAWENPEKRDAAVAFVSQLTSDRVIDTFVTTEVTALKQHLNAEGLDPLQQSAALTLEGTTGMVAAVQDSISSEARASLFSNIRYVVSGELSAQEAVELALQLNR